MERSPRVPVSHGQRVAEPGLLPRLSERLTALCSSDSKRVCVWKKRCRRRSRRTLRRRLLYALYRFQCLAHNRVHPHGRPLRQTTVVIPLSWMSKLRHREGGDLPWVTGLVTGRAVVRMLSEQCQSPCSEPLNPLAFDKDLLRD